MDCISKEVLETKKKKIQPNQESEEIINKKKHNLKEEIKERKMNKDETKLKDLNNKDEKEKKQENEEEKKEEKKEEREQNKTEEIKLELNENKLEEIKPKDEESEKDQNEEKEKKQEKDKIYFKAKKEIEEQKNNSIVEYNSNKKNFKGILSGIKSKYILENIIGHISKKKKLYLVNYSKYLQKYFNITINDYQAVYLDNIIPSNNLEDFLNHFYTSNTYDTDKSKRKEFYKKFLTDYKCDQKIIEEYIIKKYEEKFEEFKGNTFSFFIDINNPFYNLIFNSKIMNGFSLNIAEDLFKNENLVNDISNFFMKLEEYPEIKLILPFNYLDMVKLLNINFKKVKRFMLNYPMMLAISDHIDDRNEYSKKIFSFFNEKENLEDLSLMFLNQVNAESLEAVNGFVNLKSLQINNINLNDVFTLKLPNLKKLIISDCERFAFSENHIYNLEELYIQNSKVNRPNSLLKFPELKYFLTDSVEISSFLDLTSAKKLQSISENMSDLLKIEIPSIEHLTIEENENITPEIEKEAIQKILDLKNLKSITIKGNFNDEQIKNIKNVNSSVKSINFLSAKNILNYFLEKFTNLNSISLIPYISPEIDNNIFEIKEDINSKINDISLLDIPNGILYCQSFESLKKIRFEFYRKINNIEKIFPLFNHKCNMIFKSLNEFSLTYDDINEEFLNILNANMDYIVYLFNFELKTNQYNISESCYNDFIKKILSKKINNIKIELENSAYMTKQEIKEISPHFKFVYHGTVLISKFKK